MSVLGYLDQVVHSDPDSDRLTELLEAAEQRLDSQLQRRFDVPFTEADHPEAYSMAQKVVGRWAAAEYMREKGQAEGRPEEQWGADALDKAAEEFIQLFETQRAPADADDAADAFQFVPTDGQEASDRPAIFKRAHVTSGSSSHW